MADDIDIEEHDVLDNPAIKSIFPDISALKKEISQYFEDEPEIKTESVLLEICSQKCMTATAPISIKVTDLPPGQHVNTKQQINTLIVDKDLSELPENILKNQNHKNTCLNFNSNKIILGSKPCKDLHNDSYEDAVKPRRPQILLQDLHIYLDKSKRFCEDCLILFPKKLALYNHKKNVHSQKNKNESNTNVNSKIILGTIRSKTNHKCNICKTFFFSSSNLSRHYKNIHKSNLSIDMGRKKQEHITSRLRNKRDMSKEPKNVESESIHACFHCQKSFPNQKFLIEHLYNILDPMKIECHECSEKFKSQEKLSLHILDKHKNQQHSNSSRSTITENKVNSDKRKIANCIESLTKKRKIIKKQVKDPSKNINSKIFQNFKTRCNLYQCNICSYFLNSLQAYTRHMNIKHKVKPDTKVKKVSFNSQCKYCPSKSTNMAGYHSHLNNYHKDKLEMTPSKANNIDNIRLKKSDENVSNKSNITGYSESQNTSNEMNSAFALKSTLFKCNKCDIHFLSSTIAMKHLDHMEMLINWKCSICQRIFKKTDEVLHLKQHSFCEKITVYDLCETALAKVLYNCPKCTIHYTEESYLRHYSACGSETPNSVYCKNCDLLIEKHVMDSHEYHHKHKNHKTTDFTIIESEVIYDNEENILDTSNTNNLKRKIENVSDTMNEFIPRKRLFEQIFNMSYCQTCKCFLTDIALSRKAHVKSRCAHIQKHVCNLCGLVLTNKAMHTHRKLHRKTKNLKLQDYTFYNLNGKRICPPVPEYPRCDICKIHFLTKVAVKGHICSEEEYLTCHICQMKLSEVVFKLHMSFHTYSMNRAKNPLLQASSSEILEPITNFNTPEVKKEILKINLKSVANENFDSIRFKLLYSCKSCYTTLDTYDKVIEHCQSHYSKNEKKKDIIKCSKCCLKFDRVCYENHQHLHLHNISFKVLNFDTLYFMSEDNIWIKHLFGSIPRDRVQKILAESIYQFERRIKMEIIQKGSPHLTLYKCDKCNNFIDPINLYKHGENSCFKVRKHPCSICGLPFISSASRIEHEKIHKLHNLGIKSYNIVTFNRNEDKMFNDTIVCSVNQYVLYQCRNCDGIVDKFRCNNHECNRNNLRKCPICGLLTYKEDYDSHVTKHKDLIAFNVENIKVVLFGEKNEKDEHVNKTLNSSFNGMLYDYTMYKCIKCEICVKNEQCALKHTCYFDSNRSKCPNCELYFFKRALKYHLKLHESDPEFERDYIKLIAFDGSMSAESDMISKEVYNKKISLSHTETSNNNETTYVTEDVETESNDRTEKVVKIYKCVCGLHFLDELKTMKHLDNCNSKIRTKQNCSKCGLLFTPSELFAHLLAHHGDKSHVYKFDIVEIQRKDETMVYKCSKCNLHFMENEKAAEHNKDCEGTENGGEECRKCNLVFHSSSFPFHHYKNCREESKVIIVTESVFETSHKEIIETNTDGVKNLLLEADLVRDNCYNISRECLSKIDVTKYNSTIYKCKECSVHYLNKDTMRRHNAQGKHDLPSIKDVCNICGLNFTLQSLAKHIYIHHEKLNLMLNDFIITDSI